MLYLLYIGNTGKIFLVNIGAILANFKYTVYLTNKMTRKSSGLTIKIVDFHENYKKGK